MNISNMCFSRFYAANSSCLIRNLRYIYTFVYFLPQVFTHRRSCRRPHHYQAESHYLVRAKGPLPARHCNMTFAESEWSANSPDQQCYSLCIKLINASMTSCDFKMTYYDGIGDPKPRVCKLEILEMHGIERLYFGSLKDYRAT